MNLSLISLLVITAGCSCLAQGEFPRELCVKPRGVVTFDEKRFAGEWFVVGLIVSQKAPELSQTCYKANVRSKVVDKVVQVSANYSMVRKDNSVFTFTSIGHQMNPESKSVWLTFLKTDGTYRQFDEVSAAGIFVQSILATDYDNYALNHACRPIYVEETDQFDKVEVIEVFSRKPEMDGQLFKFLSSLLGNFGFDETTMIKVDNTVC